MVKPYLKGRQSSETARQKIRACEFFRRQIRYGLSDLPTIQLYEGEVIPEILQTEEDIEFVIADL